jgi:hypothetical protein
LQGKARTGFENVAGSGDDGVDGLSSTHWTVRDWSGRFSSARSSGHQGPAIVDGRGLSDWGESVLFFFIHVGG